MQSEQIIKEYFKNVYNNNDIVIINVDPVHESRINMHEWYVTQRNNKQVVLVYLVNTSDESLYYQRFMSIKGLRGVIVDLLVNENINIIIPHNTTSIQYIVSELDELKTNIQNSNTFQQQLKHCRDYAIKIGANHPLTTRYRIEHLMNTHIYCFENSKLIRLTKYEPVFKYTLPLALSETDAIIYNYFKNKYNKEISIICINPDYESSEIYLKLCNHREDNKDGYAVYLLNDTDETKEYQHQFKSFGKLKGIKEIINKLLLLHEINIIDIIAPINTDNIQRIVNELVIAKHQIIESEFMEDVLEGIVDFFENEFCDTYCYAELKKFINLVNVNIYTFNGPELIKLT